jgi:hypothetical protein
MPALIAEVTVFLAVVKILILSLCVSAYRRAIAELLLGNGLVPEA